MKRLFLFFAFLGIIMNSFSQSNVYHKFPTDNAIWRENSGGFQSSNCKDYQYTITGDTLVGSYTYHKIRSSGIKYFEDVQGNCTSFIMGYFDIYEGAYRNDTVNKKIFFLPPGYSVDTLLYDFDLNLGDSLPESYTNRQENSKNVVSSVDSVLVGNTYHRRLGLSGYLFGYTANYAYLIEGIGSTYGLLGILAPIFERFSYLQCFILNGITVFPDSSYQCELVSIRELDNSLFSKVTISPNPATTTLNISGLTNTATAEIYDISGKLLLTKQLNNTQVDISSLVKGLYFIKLSSKEGCVVRKFVKE